MSRLLFISTDGPMAVQMSFVGHTKQVVIIAESFLKKSVYSGAPIIMNKNVFMCMHWIALNVFKLVLP